MHTVESTKSDLNQAVQRMIDLTQLTPDEQATWKPSPTARSIVEIVAHSAHALDNIRIQMQGTPFAIPTSSEANRGFLIHDAKFETKHQAIAEIEAARDRYFAFLDGLSEADLDRMAKLPFGLGEAPIRFFMVAGANHTTGHNAQIEYIQTILGDHDWHTGF